MRDRVSKNAAKLKTLLGQTQSELQAIGNKVSAEVSKVEDEDRENATGSFDARDLSRTALNVLFKINSGRFDPDIDDDATMDALDDLIQFGLVDKSEKITAKGKQAVIDFRKNLSAKPSKDDMAKKDWQNRDELADTEL
jgi:Skp family chaperone for outer membrane proteins